MCGPAVTMFLITASLVGNILGGTTSGIPSRQEQTDLLVNVEEVFKQVRALVDEEGKLTDKATVADLKRLVKREQDKLCLMEELALLKLTCANLPCTSEAKTGIQHVIQEGHVALEQCINTAIENVTRSSTHVFNMTEKATKKGQTLLDTLNGCSKKSGVHQISCYRNVMLNDVHPVKTMLLEAMRAHRKGHEEVMLAKESSTDCVDRVMGEYRIKIARILAEGLDCRGR